MQGVHVARIGAEKALIRLLGHIQPARLMMLQRLLEQVRHRSVASRWSGLAAICPGPSFAARPYDDNHIAAGGSILLKAYSVNVDKRPWMR